MFLIEASNICIQASQSISLQAAGVIPKKKKRNEVYKLKVNKNVNMALREKGLS